MIVQDLAVGRSWVQAGTTLRKIIQVQAEIISARESCESGSNNAILEGKVRFMSTQIQ